MSWKLVVGGVLVVALVAAAALFEPWRIFTSSRVDEAVPAATPQPEPTGSQEPGAQEVEGGDTVEPAEPVELATGRFEDAEHGTTGSARIIELADGRRFVRFEDLATSDGPDLHVWLSESPSGGDWGSYDDGGYVRLGELKATHGNQNYEIPADAQIGSMRSVVVWCDRFDVAFGTAPVDLARA